MLNIERLLSSFGFAAEGLVHAFKRDQNLRIHVLVAFIVIMLALFFNVSELEMVAIIVVISIVFIAELVNTTVEKIVDFMVQEHVHEAKIIKDVAAGMVLIAVCGSVLVGVLIFLPKIFVLLTK